MNHTENSPDEGFERTFEFIVKLGVTAHGYGSTAPRLEAYLTRVAKTLGYQGTFRSTPKEIFLALVEKGKPWQRTRLVPMPGTGLELTRLAKIGKLVDGVEAGDTTLEEASAGLDEIDRMPHPWGNIANAISYALVGSSFAVLLAGVWWDVLFGGLLSLVVFGMVQMSGRLGGRYAEWLPLSSAFVAGVLATVIQSLVPEVNIVLVTLAAILVLIPGFSITVGIVELLSGHVVSGSVNLVNGLVYLVKQFVGAWLGIGLAAHIWHPTAVSGTPVESVWLWLAMPALVVGLCVIFQTALKDLFWASLGCGIAYGGILLGGAIAGSNLGNLIGTILAVVYANMWADKTGRPTSIVMLPAIILLVSGSIGFRGLVALAAGQTATGEQQFIQMFVVAVTIAAGLLVGYTLARPKATL